MCKNCDNLSDTKLTEKCAKIEPNYHTSLQNSACEKIYGNSDILEAIAGWDGFQNSTKFDTCANSVSMVLRGMALFWMQQNRGEISSRFWSVPDFWQLMSDTCDAPDLRWVLRSGSAHLM